MSIINFSYWPANPSAKSLATFFWFRVFGYGIHLRWVHPGYEPLFSEGNGYVKVLKIGRLWIKGLKP